MQLKDLEPRPHRSEKRYDVVYQPQTHLRTITFHFANAPFILPRSALPSFDLDGATEQDASNEVDAYTWWQLTGETPPYTYEGFQDYALAYIANAIRADGPFDGIVGFSQGAALAVMVASLLEPGRREVFKQAKATGGMRYPSAFHGDYTAGQPPLKFVIPISGFANLENPLYKAFYHPKIRTPSLHILGRTDEFIKPEMSRNLINCFDDPEVLFHSGGHRVPQIDDLERADGLSKFLRGISNQ
ncbi:hypothetical protein AUEXF2481DRAFT_87762 [Aureobasidium subglaciale EXF-2481]|uniref:Serine hydrolase domain-containing protein n=1 Tax=Aureobasidium subglaciale (strain EXF-2481) TaxID=1043005 RepID=A0A074YQH3_AURSE|nr:uncharacterized protein AUEXF2481DRAFT_87762 [Aureobasidium subglaciale EXF-2481]KAI5201294.1 hypothetical protein E4T38_06154 [Aureobasidium subglaciale]KAI5219859.1 hypothetical protein E4T40_06175 [Aureobasidium subglaciale]KAI5223632.1 hypothetical protein E4T41_06022 [Aureobasidium subglaciale]KAI5260503.1 hypothetical protein E4T46_05909 [Aureobasidium subglaciale]KEQ96342.1 hypothetical protein AUEXF2481DRAFT_87762 [Aureobasidium subglaciale EXF-2481]